ncbi:MAG: hypothetical protein AAGB93_15780 [Planctomycetota bacterium]
MAVPRLALACLATASTAALLAFTSTEADASDHVGLATHGVGFAPQKGVSGGPIGGPGCLDRIAMSPVATMTTAGSTLLGGPIMSSITIYSNGLILTSETALGGASAAGTAFVDPSSVEDLAQTLRAAGAFELCDQSYDVYDVPLRTVTVFSGGQDARAHSYSYYVPDEGHQQAEDAILGFLVETVLSR